MTPEEKRQFEEWQLKTENRMNFLIEQQAHFETQLQEFRAQAEQDRKVMKDVISEVHGAVGEMREGFNLLISISEELKENIVILSKHQTATNRRLDQLEHP